MRAKLLSYYIVIIFSLALALSPRSFGDDRFSGLMFEVGTDKQSYLLGELISLRFSVINKSGIPVYLHGYADVWVGTLRVFIAYEEGGYREYRGPRWGLKDVRGAKPMRLGPGGSYETEATILYNHRFETRHLNPISAKAITEKYIDTEYALAKLGKYQIKAILHTKSENKIESDPIQIEVNEPQGLDDIEVWNVLKSDSEYAYFIQTGGPRGHPTSAKARQIVETLEEMVNFYSTSKYIEQIRSSLSKYHSSIERLKKAGTITSGD